MRGKACERPFFALSIRALAWGLALSGTTALAQQTAIVSISVCSPTGAGGAGSCPSGTSDTHQIVLAPDGSGKAINGYNGIGGVSDEHQSIFAPGALQANSDYLFFVATQVAGGAPSTGVVVLSGGSGPGKNGQWTLDFAKTDGYGSYASGYGTIFVAPTAPNCPTAADGNPAHQDSTFDLTYAAPGSVVTDPTGPAGSLLMVYEGTNTCFGIASGSNNGNNFYSSVGIATSQDYGRTWPTYRGTTGFSFVPLPGANKNQGPGATTGALGSSVCEGNDCTTTPPANYGRYPVLSPSVSIGTAMALGTSLPGSMGDSEMSAFVDDASTNPAQYIYAVYDYKAGTGALTDPAAPNGGVMIARAQLNGGTAALSFLKWNGNAFAGAGMGGYDTLLFPTGPFSNCEGAAQLAYGASISYVDATQQYLLTFVCDSPGDPALGQVAGAARGGAWFYSTSYSLSDPTQWTPPQEIAGSWAPFDQSGGCSSYKGFYPTLMSPGAKTGHLSTSGYIFYLYGCQTDNTPPPGRQYSSRQFTITTGPAPPALASGTLANGATYVSGGLVPGSWAQVKGNNLSNTTRIWTAADFTGLGNNLPTNLSGVQVKVNNLPAAVYYISPTQISFQVPTGVTGTASVEVINNGLASNTVTAPAATNSPGIFPVVLNGTNYPAGVFYVDGLYVGDPSNGPAFRNARPGDIVELYATGLVPTPGGVLPSSLTVSGVTVTIGNVTVPATFAGLVAVGEFQINFTVPQQFASMAAGRYPISIQVNGVSSPVTINSNPPGQMVLPVQQ